MNEENASLLRLGHTELFVSAAEEDLRGRTVVGRAGEEIGEISNLLIADRQTTARFLPVTPNGSAAPDVLIHLRGVNNVIIRNLAFRDGEDVINIERSSHHIRIDHCDFSRCKDGLVDIKQGSDFVTVSWSRFHAPQKTSLLGHIDSASARAMDKGHLRVTYHHNFFDGSKTRNPRV